MARARLQRAGVAIAARRVQGRRGSRALAQPDEDAVTLATEAAASALAGVDQRPGALFFASTSAPYARGGSVQPLAELLGLNGNLFALDLGSTRRDGVAALRLAVAVAAAGNGPVLVCAAHAADAEAEPRAGAAAVAMLIEAGEGEGEPLAELAPGASSVEELRDSWQLAGAAETQEADRSFVADIGTDRLARSSLGNGNGDRAGTVTVTGPEPRAAARLERVLDGPGDDVAAKLGELGAAHAPLRLLLSLGAGATTTTIVGNGFAETIEVLPTESGRRFAEGVRDEIEAGVVGDAPAARTRPADFEPYSSPPRSWRDRDVDFRLAGIIPSADGGSDADAPARRRPVGSVVTWVRDHVYPAAPVTDMAVVQVDGGGRFFGQVAQGQEVGIGDRVTLVPRRLHEGGEVVQYFWKVVPCQ
jgi:hydroxymethylglutaryl-CoA synthase